LSSPHDRFTTPALGILVAAFAVRALHVWQMRTSPFFSTLMGDSRGYDEWARRIAAGDWIGREVFYQAPLYPYMLGVIYTVAGRHLLFVRLIQAAIGSASCVLLAAAATRLFDRRTGIAAGFMLALYAPAIFFDGLLQKSVLDVFFICLALWLIAKAAEASSIASVDEIARPRAKTANALFMGLGVTMGALALTRENAIVLIVVTLLWIAVARGSKDASARIAPAASFVAGLAIVLAPVAARNAYVGGGFYITTSQAGPNFYIGNNPKADGTYQSLRVGRGAPEYERQDATELAERALGRPLTPAEVSSYWTDRALDFIAAQPRAWLTLMARKFMLVWNATEMVDTESQEAHAEYSLPLRALGIVGHFGVLVPLAVGGAIVTWPMRRRLWILYVMIGAYATSVVFFYVFARYRYPLVPLLVLFASAGVAAIVPRRTTTANTGPVTIPGEHGKSGKPRKAVGPLDEVHSRGPRANQIRVQRGTRPAWVAAAMAATAIFCNWPILSAATMQAVTETNLGVALQNDGRLDDAIAHYRRAIALAPDYAASFNNLGAALRARGKRDEAVASYQRAIELRPDFAGAHYNLANLLMDEGEASAAVEHFDTALKTEPGSAEVHNNLGIALAGLGRLDDAVAEFHRAIALDPNSAKAYRNLGDALSTAGKEREALDNLRRAARLDPSDAAIRYDLASALLEAGLLDEAIAEFREALKARPNFVEAHNNLGIALGSAGRLDEAIQEFRAALAIDANFADAKRNLRMAEGARRR
jgi:tetratricopeptide (TPR) repeat protein/4-amino-4-deoxy-L-arabinose transferase-like glycosyltransferase